MTCKPLCLGRIAEEKHGIIAGEIYYLLCDCKPIKWWHFSRRLSRHFFGPPQEVISELRDIRIEEFNS